MLACAIGDCNIDVFTRVVEATGKGNYFSAIHTCTNGRSKW